MIFTELPLPGAYLIQPELLEDERGFFTRVWSKDEFAAHSLASGIDQISMSFNARRATLRGLHYQEAPHAEAKVVRCTRGSIYDVLVDLRPDSSTYCEWTSIDLSRENRAMVYVPEGMAHGFITLADESEVLYQMSVPFFAESARGLRWNDRVFGIRWPLHPAVISERDANYMDFTR
jgi:dTDP-4-dehydrorhamnose 3,5-epimerase